MFSLLLTIWLIIQGFLLWFPWFFVQELIISFLPYALGFNILILVILLCSSILTKKKRFFALILWYSILWYLLYTTYQWIYHISITQDNTTTWNNDITFFYGNIYYQNKETEQLVTIINSSNPDIIMLVEYSKSHDELLTPLLKKAYPYVSRYIGSKWYDGDIIFSKYPIKNITHTVIPWSFSHITVSHSTQDIDIALVHTSAPVSKHYFDMRTNQLHELDNLLNTYYSWENKNHRLIVAGDFNITPWSSYYTTQMKLPFERIGLTNITTNTTATTYNRDIPYTRCLSQANLICAHIDHIRSNMSSIQLKQITLPWSDHYGFVGTIRLP